MSILQTRLASTSQLWVASSEEHPDLCYQAPHRHWKHILGDCDMRWAERMINSGQACNGADVWKELFPDVSSPTVCQRLNEYGLEGHVRGDKPYLSARHMRGWRALIAEFKNWEEDWDAVVFSDELKFQLFGSDGKRYYCRRKGDWYKKRNVKKTMKHGGGSLMVWGCIRRWGTGQLIQVEGNMDQFQYVKILKWGLLGTLRNYDLNTDSIYFQQDSNPKHTSQHAMEYFKSQGINLLPWRSQSADLNIIEPAWGHLDK